MVDVGETFELADVEIAPELVSADEMAAALSRSYPQLLRDAGVSGQVMLRFRVTSEGAVDPASVTVESATSPHFEEAAREALEGMSFTPAQMEGHPVPVWMPLPMAFEIDSCSLSPESSAYIYSPRHQP